jgi:hypothetical protein
MRVDLLISSDCPSCDRALSVWKELCRARGIDFQALNIQTPRGAELGRRWGLRTVPAVLIGGNLMGVGVQSPAQAEALIDRAGSGPGSGPPG